MQSQVIALLHEYFTDKQDAPDNAANESDSISCGNISNIVPLL